MRAAIQEANASSSTDTIFFVIPETDPGFDGASFTINLVSALPDLSTNMTLRGPDANVLTVQRNAAAEFSVFTVTSQGLVSFYGMTISNGSAVNGGGINNLDGGTVDVSFCKLLGNTASEDGGGIENDGTGNLNIAYSTLNGNTAAQGGAINNQNRGGLFISNCTSESLEAELTTDQRGIGYARTYDTGVSQRRRRRRHGHRRI